MDTYFVRGKWSAFKEKLRAEYDMLTDAEIEETGGDRELLEAKVAEKCGRSRKEARATMDRILSSV